jgi:ribosomal protein S18 acetylase RimI-like enzyme
MDSSIKVYRIEADEADRFGLLVKTMWMEAKETGSLLGWSGATDEVIEELTSKDVIREILVQNMVYVAEIEGTLVGFAALRLLDDEGGELAGIMVMERYTGRGVGSELFRNVLEAARKAGLSRLIVKTERDNIRAISFYKKMGFKLVKETVEKVADSEVAIVILSLDL